MAQIHNELRRTGALLRGIKNALGVTDGEAGVERFSETLQPVFNIWDRPEWEILRGEILFSRSALSGGVALLFSSIELVNPATANVLAVVTLVRNAGAGLSSVAEIQVDSGAALGAVATTRGIARDSRYPQLGAVSQCTVVTGNLAAGANLPQRFLDLADQEEQGYIIHPGRKLFVLAVAAAAALRVSLAWRERPVFQGELIRA